MMDEGKRRHLALEKIETGVDHLRRWCKFPEYFRGKGIKNYKVTNGKQKLAVEAAEEFLADWRGKWLAFVGRPGTGKGHLSMAIANGIIRELAIEGKSMNHSPVLYMKHIRLIRMIRSSYSGKDLTEEEAVARLDAPALLIVDEVGLKDDMSAWERSTLDDLFDYRYEHGKALIITSNLSAAELFDMLGERVRSRFSERGRIIPFTWDDYRKGQ